MQEIKFRGKRKDNDEWVEGSMVRDGSTVYIVREEPDISLRTCSYRTCDKEWHICEYDMSEVHPETVGQYTGLKDNKGVEIYEGDIVKSIKEYNQYSGMLAEIYGGNVYRVEYHPHSYRLLPEIWYVPDWNHIEVIGNIHENPELIE